MLKIVTEMGSMSGMGITSPFGQSAASSIRDSREREKKEMSDLNDRLATYIEKVFDSATLHILYLGKRNLLIHQRFKK